MPSELDQLRSQLQTLERDNALLRASLDPWMQFLSARWYSQNTMLAPNTLRKARGYLPHLELGKRLSYRALEVYQRWPDKFRHPRTGKMPDLPQLRKGKEREIV